MKRFISLAECSDNEIEEMLKLASALERAPDPTLLAGKVLGLIFLEPSVRTLASFQTAMARLGGSSFVISPGRGSWGMEWRPGVTMDGVAAEHMNEAIPVLEQYADALGLRCFGRGVSVAEDLQDPLMSVVAGLAAKPLINLESACGHPCQALADWKTLEDLQIPRQGGRFVLSWANHPRPLPIAVPRSTLLMAARRGMDVTVLAPPGFELPEEVMGEARALAATSGGAVQSTSNREQAMQGAQVLYAKSWRAPSAFGDDEREAALRAAVGDWCVDEPWFAGAEPDAVFMHCLPVRRNVVVSDAVLDGPRSRVVHQAGNRLNAQMGVLAKLFSNNNGPEDPR